MKITWSNAALFDMEGIQRYLEHHNPALAWKTVEQITAAADGLKFFSSRGRPGRAEDSREYVIPGLPYLIVYELNRNVIGIIRIMHTSRLWPLQYE